MTESPTLRIEAMPTLFFGAIRRMVRESDLVLLVEGSTYMDSWGSPLLWAFLWATHCAARMGKPCLAYAVDAGTLKPTNARLVRRVASRTGLIVTRNRAAAGRLRAVGVTAPILSTADNAFTFQPREADRGWVAREWPRAAGGDGGAGHGGLLPLSRGHAAMGAPRALLQVALLLLQLRGRARARARCWPAGTPRWRTAWWSARARPWR